MFEQVKKFIYIGLIINIVLTIMKVLTGLIGQSYSLFSDGVNSLSDVVISITILLTIKYASKKPDKDHPYGHEKYEAVINLFLGIFLIVTSVLLIVNSIQNMDNHVKPQFYTIIIASIAVVLKVIIYIVNIYGYKKYDQISLKTDAYNHLGDILATILSLVSIILTMNGILYLEYIAAILISVVILINGLKVIKDAINYIVDLSPSKEFNDQVKDFITSIDGVVNVDDYKSRFHVKKIYIDVEIAVDRSLSLVDAHLIAEAVHHKVEEQFENVIHCMVHVNPAKK